MLDKLTNYPARSVGRHGITACSTKSGPRALRPKVAMKSDNVTEPMGAGFTTPAFTKPTFVDDADFQHYEEQSLKITAEVEEYLHQIR